MKNRHVSMETVGRALSDTLAVFSAVGTAVAVAGAFAEVSEALKAVAAEHRNLAVALGGWPSIAGTGWLGI